MLQFSNSMKPRLLSFALIIALLTFSVWAFKKRESAISRLNQVFVMRPPLLSDMTALRFYSHNRSIYKIESNDLNEWQQIFNNPVVRESIGRTNITIEISFRDGSVVKTQAGISDDNILLIVVPDLWDFGDSLHRNYLIPPRFADRLRLFSDDTLPFDSSVTN